MVKVLVIITTSMVPYGGLTSVIMNLYRKIDKNSFHIDFASTNEELDEVLKLELHKNGSEYYSLGNRERKLPEYVRRLSILIKDGKYDVIHINSNSATALIELRVAKRNGVKKRIVHNHTSICDHKLLHRICYPFFRNTYTDAIACSKKAGEWIFKDGNFQILNNGIDTERYRFSWTSREQIRKQYDILESTIVLGHVGKIYKPKNHLYLVQVFDEYHKINPDSCLLLVGDGEMRSEVEEDVWQRGLSSNVIFTGMQQKTEAYLAAIDIFVFPSLWEGMPLAMIEAQASGLHCLASNTIDKGVVVTENVKMLSIDLDASNWAQEIERLDITNRSRRSGEAINQIISAGFDSRQNASELEKKYSDVKSQIS